MGFYQRGVSPTENLAISILAVFPKTSFAFSSQNFAPFDGTQEYEKVTSFGLHVAFGSTTNDAWWVTLVGGTNCASDVQLIHTHGLRFIFCTTGFST